MTNALIKSALIGSLILISSCKTEAGNNCLRHNRQIAQMISSHDLDGDQRLSYEEWEKMSFLFLSRNKHTNEYEKQEALKQLLSDFSDVDINKSGYLEQVELGHLDCSSK